MYMTLEIAVIACEFRDVGRVGCFLLPVVSVIRSSPFTNESRGLNAIVNLYVNSGRPEESARGGCLYSSLPVRRVPTKEIADENPRFLRCIEIRREQTKGKSMRARVCVCVSRRFAVKCDKYITARATQRQQDTFISQGDEQRSRSRVPRRQ